MKKMKLAIFSVSQRKLFGRGGCAARVSKGVEAEDKKMVKFPTYDFSQKRAAFLITAHVSRRH